MKLYSKLFFVAMGCAAWAGCSDMDDMDSEGFRITDDQNRKHQRTNSFPAWSQA